MKERLIKKSEIHKPRFNGKSNSQISSQDLTAFAKELIEKKYNNESSKEIT